MELSKEQIDEIIRDDLKHRVIRLTQEKTQMIYNLLAGRQVDQTQIARYKQKEVWARNDEDQYLQAEAELQGMSVEELKVLIIEMADAWRVGFDTYSSQIETFRIITNRIIDSGDFEKAEQILRLGAKLGKGATIEDIKALFWKE